VKKIAYQGKVVNQGPWYNRRSSHVTIEEVIGHGLRKRNSTNIQENSDTLESVKVELKDVEVTMSNNRQAFRFFADMLNRLYFIFTFTLLTTAFFALLAKNILRSDFEE